MATEATKDVAAESAPAAKTASLSDAVAAKVVKQMNFWFGDFNLPRDKFLREKVCVCLSAYGPNFCTLSSLSRSRSRVTMFGPPLPSTSPSLCVLVAGGSGCRWLGGPVHSHVVCSHEEADV